MSLELTEGQTFGPRTIKVTRTTLVRYAGASGDFNPIHYSDCAAREAGIDVFEGQLSGPTAIAFIKGEPVEPAKALRDFAKDHEKLVLKGGYMDGQPLDEAGIKKLADLESREVLLAKFAGAMKGSMSKAAALFQAPLSKTVRTVEALRAAQGEAA